MTQADRLGARYVIVLGEDEVKTGRGRLKEMKEGKEEEIALDPGALAGKIKGRF